MFLLFLDSREYLHLRTHTIETIEQYHARLMDSDHSPYTHGASKMNPIEKQLLQFSVMAY